MVATESIKVSKETKRQLENLGKYGQSMEDIIRTLLEASGGRSEEVKKELDKFREREKEV